MLEETARDYADFFKLDISSEFHNVQDVIDNMLTRLEELTSVLQMVKLKNLECSSAVAEDINKYRSEITTLSKKILTITCVVSKLKNNIDLLEKQVEKAEIDFGINNENKITHFLKPFLKRNKDITSTTNAPTLQTEKVEFKSVLDSFENTES